MIWVNLLWVYSGFSVCRVYWKSGIFVTKEVSLAREKQVVTLNREKSAGVIIVG